MKLSENTNVTILTLTPHDTWKWASSPDQKWSCSVLSGRALIVAFDHRGDLLDYDVEDEDGNLLEDVDVPGDEFNAITTDHLPAGHPARRSEGA